jgi:hypothetical protein
VAFIDVSDRNAACHLDFCIFIFLFFDRAVGVGAVIVAVKIDI